MTKCFFIAFAVTAICTQADNAASTGDAGSVTNTPAARARAFEQATEKIRADCVEGRRIICGKIVNIISGGLVVDSGYTNLMRTPLNKSWLVPGTVQAVRPGDLIESREPGSVCVGLVFLTGLPKSRLAKPKLYDYVVLQAYPAGHYTYNSVGTMQRTVRRFSAKLPIAIQLNRADAGIEPPVVAADNK